MCKVTLSQASTQTITIAYIQHLHQSINSCIVLMYGNSKTIDYIAQHQSTVKEKDGN